MLIPTIGLCVHPSETIDGGGSTLRGHHNSFKHLISPLIMISTCMMKTLKLCTLPIVLTLTFLWPFCKVTKNFSPFDHERGSLCGHHNSIEPFDIDLCAQYQLFWPWPFFDLFESAGGFVSVRVTLLSPANCGVSFWTCSREISGDRVVLFPLCWDKKVFIIFFILLLVLLRCMLYYYWFYYSVCYIITGFTIVYVILLLVLLRCMLYYYWFYCGVCYIITGFTAVYVILFCEFLHSCY